MIDPKQKLLIAQEYLFFLKSLAASFFIFLVLNSIIWITNKYGAQHNDKVSQKVKNILTKIGSLQNMDGSPLSAEFAQHDLYEYVQKHKDYSISFEEFKGQLIEATGKQEVYKTLIKDELFTGNFDAFQAKYFPSVDKKLQDSITNLKHLDASLRKKYWATIPFLSWKLAIFLWVFICYILRLTYFSIKRSTAIVKQHKTGA